MIRSDLEKKIETHSRQLTDELIVLFQYISIDMEKLSRKLNKLESDLMEVKLNLKIGEKNSV